MKISRTATILWISGGKRLYTSMDLQLVRMGLNAVAQRVWQDQESHKKKCRA